MIKLSDIKGVGPKRLEALYQNGINSIKSLIFSFPLRYTIYEESYDDFLNGNDTVISGVVDSKPVVIKYHTVNAIIFYIIAFHKRYKCIVFSGEYLRSIIKPNTIVLLYGKYNKLKHEIQVKKVFNEEFKSKIECDYKLKDVPNYFVSNTLEKVFSQNVIISEYLPLELIDKYKLCPIDKYIYLSHFPSTKEDVKEVLRRRKYEEFFWYSLRLNSLKQARIYEKKEPRYLNSGFIKQFLGNVDFELTTDQLNVISEIKKDVLSDKVLNRLLQGDVGSGKSIVAYIFSAMIVSSKFQVAYMAPTEILAKQVYDDIKKYYKNLDVKIELLTSSVKQKEKNDIYNRLAEGRIDIIIGTHALIEDKVMFSNLGGVIIDEQHRFGVNARQKLVSKYKGVDALYMSATPIPRSLGLSFFGDLDISSIHTMPAGRKKVTTRIVNNQNFGKMISFLDKEIEGGHQAYVVCPSIVDEDSPTISVEKCLSIYNEALPHRKIGFIHGKLDNLSKNQIMNDFVSGKYDILISTTIIEVGVNVKNATVMIIMDAHRFGLATLHQLRGRVGRSNFKSYCFLVSDDEDNERLKAIEEENDGFNISEIDFRLRGPGDYFGTEQSGFNNFLYSSFEEDYKIFVCANKDAQEYYKKYENNEYSSKIFDEILIYNLENIGKSN